MNPQTLLREACARDTGKPLPPEPEMDMNTLTALMSKTGLSEIDKTRSTSALIGVLKLMPGSGGCAAHVEDMANVLGIHGRHVRAALLALVDVGWCLRDARTDTFYPTGDFLMLCSTMDQHFYREVKALNPRLFALMSLGAEAVK